MPFHWRLTLKPSFCLQVYAVDASDMADYARRIVKLNGQDNVVEVTVVIQRGYATYQNASNRCACVPRCAEADCAMCPGGAGDQGSHGRYPAAREGRHNRIRMDGVGSGQLGIACNASVQPNNLWLRRYFLLYESMLDSVIFARDKW